MALAGFATTVKASGIPVAATGEATTSLGSNVFQVTATARRIIDPNAAVVVRDGGVPISAANVLIDYLFGKFTLSSPPGGAVTADFSFLPVNTIAEVRKASLKRSRNLLDRTTFDSGGVRQRLAGLKDLEGSLEGLAFVGDDLDPGDATESVDSFFESGVPRLLEIRPGGSGDFFRCWFLFEDQGQDVSFDGLREASLPFKGTALTGVGQTEGAASGWGT